MTVNIALFLSADGIALAHRQAAGHWAMIGETPLAAIDLDAALAALRAEAADREGEDFKALLVLPDDQMLYTSLTVPTSDPELTAFRIEEGLDGMTPYAVTELEYDWRMLEEDRVKIAVVARETLDEAKAFAAQYGFNGAGFAAMPPMERFPGVPMFNVEGDASDYGFSAEGIAFGPDTHGQPEPEPEPDVIEPEVETAPETSVEEAIEIAPEPEAEPAPEINTAAPAPEPEDTSQNAALADALDIDSEPELAEIPAIDDISTPIQPLSTEAPDTPVEDAITDEDPVPPAPSPASRDAKQRARVIRGEGPTTAPADAPPSEAAPQFAARRGPATAPDAAVGSLVGQRSSRLGLSEATDAAAPVKPAPETGTDGANQATKAGMPRLAERLQRVHSASKTKPTGAAPPRPRVEIEPRPPEEAATQDLGARPSPFEEQTPEQPDEMKSGARKGLLGGALRGRGGASAGASATGGDAAAAPAEDGSFSSGLLARKAAPTAGPSFRTGLILTAILLLLLALVAIWSAVFLPNSPVARLFGFSAGEEQIATAPEGVEAPDVFAAAPDFGNSAAPDFSEAPSFEDEAAADGIDLAALVSDDAVLPVEDEAALPDDEVAELPDIDADLDLPPLPPIDQGENPSVEEAEALYAEDGIWARSPDRPDLRPFDLLDRIYTASIDPQISALDAVALPEPGVNPGELLRRVPPPPPFGARFDLTEDGLVAATAQGALTPEGAFVVAGAPPAAARQRPREIAEETPNIDVGDAILGTFRPVSRPTNLDELRERQVLGGLTTSELSERRPPARPQSPQEAAAAASLFPSEDAEGTDEATGVSGGDVAAALEEAIGGSNLATARSLLPTTRPGNIAQIVASADRRPVEEPTAVVIAAAAVAPGPDIPSNSDVSRAATQRDAIRLRNVNLIGVSGTNTDRRALVRLSSGRFVRVSVGDRLDGGRVAAIGETTLQYVRSGRTVTLEIPG